MPPFPARTNFRNDYAACEVVQVECEALLLSGEELERITAGIAELKEQQAAEAQRNEERDKKADADAEALDSINLEDITI